MPFTLVLGGARSGKTRWAQEAALAEARARGVRPLMVVTAEPGDAEMRERIARHQTDRGEDWRTVEAPHDLAGVLLTALGPGDVAVVDCLTLWLSNRMGAEADVGAVCAELAAACAQAPAALFLVSNEVGLGIVPDNALARRFRDEAGRLHQQLAALATGVVFIAAGLPMRLK